MTGGWISQEMPFAKEGVKEKEELPPALSLMWQLLLLLAFCWTGICMCPMVAVLCKILNDRKILICGCVLSSQFMATPWSMFLILGKILFLFIFWGAFLVSVPGPSPNHACPVPVAYEISSVLLLIRLLAAPGCCGHQHCFQTFLNWKRKLGPVRTEW